MCVIAMTWPCLKESLLLLSSFSTLFHDRDRDRVLSMQYCSHRLVSLLVNHTLHFYTSIRYFAAAAALLRLFFFFAGMRRSFFLPQPIEYSPFLYHISIGLSLFVLRLVSRVHHTNCNITNRQGLFKLRLPSFDRLLFLSPVT